MWREGYANTGLKKPGQTQKGSGTTPTLFGHGLVAITDNADPIRVVVMRRGRSTGGRARTVCATPVFNKGASSDDQSLIAVNRSLIAENNFGYTGPAVGPARPLHRAAGARARRRAPQPERLPARSGARTSGRRRWCPRSRSTAGWSTPTPSPRATRRDPWYLTALDFRTGRTVWKQLAGYGLGHNNNYAPVTIGPDNGTAYIGALGGLIALRDATRPTLPRSPRLKVAGAVRQPARPRAG